MKLLTLTVLLLSKNLFSADTLIVYSYDSLVSKDSFGLLVKSRFEKKYHSKIKFVSFGSAGEALNQINIDGEKTQADILFGADNSLLQRLKKTAAFEPANMFIPFDYGYLGFVYDAERTKDIPTNMSLKDFSTLKRFHKNVVIEDPRTSSIGLGFLIWTHALLDQKEVSGFWRDFSEQIFTITPGWSGAYGIFLKKNADFVLSYTTSPAYHLENEHKKNIKCLIFPEGHYLQEEGLSITKGSKQKSLAKKFTDFVLSEEIQKEIPLKQWMYPVLKSVKLPESFKELPEPKALKVGNEIMEHPREEWLDEWALAGINK